MRRLTQLNRMNKQINKKSIVDNNDFINANKALRAIQDHSEESINTARKPENQSIYFHIYTQIFTAFKQLHNIFHILPLYFSLQVTVNESHPLLGDSGNESVQ